MLKYNPRCDSYGKGGVLCGKAVQDTKRLGPGVTKHSLIAGLENTFLKNLFNPKGLS